MNKCVARTGAALGVCLALAGCGGLPFGARALVPPESGIRTAALYTAPERPGFNRTGPVSLRLMCNVPDSLMQTISYQPESTVADIDLMSSFAASGSVSGIRASVLSADLQGSFSDYFELKLTNVVKRSISDEEARAVFSRFMARSGCQGAYAADRYSRTIYQVLAVYVGDVQFGVKRDGLFSADLALKLKALEPKAKAELKRVYNVSFSGRQMVGAVETVAR